MLTSIDHLEEKLRTPEVLNYYERLKQKRFSLVIKRIFDVVFSFLLILLLFPVMLCIAIVIKIDSKGPVLYCQTRVTKNDKDFKIVKFRTMVVNADSVGSQITISNDSRITRVGNFLRKVRLDELPQLFNVFVGDMTFVGTRPEVRKYVDDYSPEMYATLLLPAGVTSLASIVYKDEQNLLDESHDVDKTYVEKILPNKMKYNLTYLKEFSFKKDLEIILRTIKEVFL